MPKMVENEEQKLEISSILSICMAVMQILNVSVLLLTLDKAHNEVRIVWKQFHCIPFNRTIFSIASSSKWTFLMRFRHVFRVS